MQKLLNAVKAATEAAQANIDNQKLTAMKSAIVAKNAAMSAVVDSLDDGEVRAIAKGLGFKLKDFRVDMPRVSLDVHNKDGKDKLYVSAAPQNLPDGSKAGKVYVRAESVRQTIADLQEALVLLEEAGFEV